MFETLLTYVIVGLIVVVAAGILFNGDVVSSASIFFSCWIDGNLVVMGEVLEMSALKELDELYSGVDIRFDLCSDKNTRISKPVAVIEFSEVLDRPVLLSVGGDGY